MALAAWMRPIMFQISQLTYHCNIILAYDIFAFVYNLTIILNRWLTCFMSFKRCRCLFDLAYAVELKRKSTRENVKNCLLFGILMGTLQGLTIATIRLLLGRYGTSEDLAYFFLMVHPIAFTFLVLAFTIATIVKKTLDSYRSYAEITNTTTGKYFLRSVVAVALFYSISQSANIVCLFLMGMKAPGAHTSVIVSEALNEVYLFGNFFIYLCFSKQFRVTFKDFLISIG